MIDAENYDDYDDYAETDEEEDAVREAAKAVLLPWYHAKACTPSQGCSCDMAREAYAAMPTAGLTYAAALVQGCL